MIAALAAAAAALALSLAEGPRAHVGFAPPPPAKEADRAPDEGMLRRLRPPLVALAVIAGWAVLGGWVGLGAGVVAGVLGWRVLGRAESPQVARRRATLEQDLPMAVHLLGAALVAGASTSAAVFAVADALPGPTSEEFMGIHHRLQLGLDPAEVWSGLGGPLRPLGRTMARAEESGASVRSAVEALSEDLRLGARARIETLARSVEVRAAAPLGVCFLPAFVLLGIVPMAVGIFSSLRLFG